MTYSGAPGGVVIFARANIQVAHPIADVRAALERASSGWLAGLVEESCQDASQLGTIGPEGSTHRFPTGSEVQVHPAVHLNGGLWMALDWASTAPDALFRSGAVDLEATPLAAQPGRTRIVLSASLRAADGDGAPGARPGGVVLEAAQAYIERLAQRLAAHLPEHATA